MLEKLKSTKGITLIALVITIIILLILAGVAISAISGDSGLLSKAKQSTDISKEKQAEEKVKIALSAYQIEKEKNKDVTLGGYLEGYFGKDNVEKDEQGNYVVTVDGYEVTVSPDGKIINIEKAGPKPVIENVKITTDGSIEPEDGTVEEGTPLQINFTAKMEGGEVTKIEPQVPYTTNGNETEVVFTITGQVNGENYVTKKTISLKSKYIIINQPNQPKVSQGMIPIKWNGSTWVVCNQNDPEWYKYVDQIGKQDGQSMWANIMLSDGKYKANTVKVGQIVTESDLGSMYVWIPRYAYCIDDGYNRGQNPGPHVKIAFLEGTKEYPVGIKVSYIAKGNTYEGAIINHSGSGNLNEHPAFNFGGRIVPGIWVAKFEAGNAGCTTDVTTGQTEYESKPIKIQPNKTSWRNLTVSQMFDTCREMNTKYSDIYGISDDKDIIDSHLMKNTEWGAVAYLTQSSYGRYQRSGVTVNNNESFRTGRGTYKTAGICSTTGNVTGIYDMSGGANEYVAAYVDSQYDSNYDESLVKAEEKYKDVYLVANTDEDTWNHHINENMYGDAVYECSNSGDEDGYTWFFSYSSFPHRQYKFFTRGRCIKWILCRNFCL